MQALAATKLMERGVIRQGTEFQAYYQAHGMSGWTDARVLGTFQVCRVLHARDTDCISVTGLCQSDGRLYRFVLDQIISMEGMDVPRLLRTYNLYDDGSDIPQGKRRGRRRKVALALPAHG